LCNAQLRRHNHSCGKALFLEQLPKKLLGRGLLSTLVDQDLHHPAVLSDCSQKIILLAIECDNNLIQMPLVSYLTTATTNCIAIVLSKLIALLPNCFLAHRNASFHQQFFQVRLAQGKSKIKPGSVADHLSATAVTSVHAR